ncbi:MAG: hypothetical protein GX141_09365 [Armatimonadetes bacterium]|nr:hypothetical protein [Armatimonadota bacterium]
MTGSAVSAANPVTIEKVKYADFGNCYKLTNGSVDVLVTLDVGPRVIFYGFSGEENNLAELGPGPVNKHELGEWRPWGGHRLWHAPEVMPRSYLPDNGPVTSEIIGNSTVRVAPPLEEATHIQKEMMISLAREGTRVTITHTLKNKGLWPVELAPWGLTIVRGGGTTIVPQEPFIAHGDKLLPARSLALWNFTDMSDSRFTFGSRYIRLRTDSKIKDKPQKLGVANREGWAGYLREKTLFIKTFPYVENAAYPDFGCNFETYTDGDFMEVETLGPLTKLEPNETATHVEHWQLFKNVEAGDTDESLDKALAPLLKKLMK